MELSFLPLQGRFVRLEPLNANHKEAVRGLIDVDPAAWSIMLVNPVGAGFEDFWAALSGASLTDRMPYVIFDLSNGRMGGMSSYFTALAKHGGVEIGATFLHPEIRAGAVNPETKLLMLGHAFGCGAVRVQFTVDVRNARSQAAVVKLGAVREGVLRRDRRTWLCSIGSAW